ncbi:hypothetical protein PDG61_20865 [Mycolicibacterium sp. BiH015]|nr:hypothetical protein [Mycolicibacterium sp. BiH015]
MAEGVEVGKIWFAVVALAVEAATLVWLVGAEVVASWSVGWGAW